MRQNHQRPRDKTLHMNAMTVANEARFMLQQLSLPVDPTDTIKARRERAIRRAGLSHAKGMRLWYSQTCALLAHEFLGLLQAYKDHVTTQERELERDLETLRTLRAERLQRENQLALDLQARASGLAAAQSAHSDLAGEA